MVKCNFDRKKMDNLSAFLKEKNNLSVLNQFTSRNLTQDDMRALNEIGIIDINGQVTDRFRPVLNIISKPSAMVKMEFTGGVGTYEQYINCDSSYERNVFLTMTPNTVSIEDEVDTLSISNLIEEFVGRSGLKSIHLSFKVSINEALVIAAMLDMERKSTLRAFVDEIPSTSNLYNANMIWRIINSTNSSIQWFVYIINNMVGDHVSLSRQQVQDAIDQLIDKGIIVKNDAQYKLSNDLSILSNRMLIIDSILSIQASKQVEGTGITSTGFQCVQSGVHDLLFLDFNGKELLFETISSTKLMDYIKQFLDYKKYFTKF